MQHSLRCALVILCNRRETFRAFLGLHFVVKTWSPRPPGEARLLALFCTEKNVGSAGRSLYFEAPGAVLGPPPDCCLRGRITRWVGLFTIVL